MARPQVVTTGVTPHHGDDLIALFVCSSGNSRSGISLHGYISRPEGEKLIIRLREALDSWPREATGDDLGLGT